MADPLCPATRCRLALADRFKALNLPAYGSGPGYMAPLAGRVYHQIEPDESNLAYPCLVLTPAGLAETIADDTNAADLVGYPVAVGICEKNGRAQHDKLAAVEYWRHRLVSAVRVPRLPGVPELVRMTVEPAPVVPATLPLFLHLVSRFTVRCWCRVPFSLTE